MKRLLLFRHAHAVREAQADRDRPLSERGRVDAAAVGRELARKGLLPGLVLCSPAIRTRQTLEAVTADLGTPAVVMVDEIYDARVGTLLDLLREQSDEAGPVMVIGHNPGLEELVALVREEPHGADPMKDGFPTAGVAVLELPGKHWDKLGARRCKLVELVLPPSKA